MRDLLDRSRMEFAENLARWRLLNHWAQDTAEHWGKEVGFAYVHNSQWCRLERGLAPQPGPLIFRALGLMNARIARQDWGPIAKTKLRERVQGSKPICHPSGEPWDACDFYGAFIGLLEWPPMAEPEHPITAAEAEAWSRQFKAWFEQIMQAAGLAPLDALTELMRQVPTEQQQTMQQVVLGFGSYSASALQQLSCNRELQPQQWLSNWLQSAGLELDLELGHHWRFVHRERQENG